MEGYYNSMFPSGQDLNAAAGSVTVPPSLQQQQQITAVSSNLMPQISLSDAVDPHRGGSSDALEDGGRMKRARYDPGVFDDHAVTSEGVLQVVAKDTSGGIDAAPMGLAHPGAGIPPNSASIIATGPSSVGPVGGHSGGLSREEIAILQQNIDAGKLKRGAWTKEEDDALLLAYEQFKTARKDGRPNWVLIAEQMGSGRSSKSCFCRFTEVLLPRVQRHGTHEELSYTQRAATSHTTPTVGPWTKDEDSTLLIAYSELQTASKDGRPDWALISSRLPHRSAKACYHRYSEVLQPRLIGETKCGAWDKAEDEALISAFAEFAQSGRGMAPDWNKISNRLGNIRSPAQYRKRYMRVLHSRTKAIAARAAVAAAGIAPSSAVIPGLPPGVSPNGAGINWHVNEDTELLLAFENFKDKGPSGEPDWAKIAHHMGSTRPLHAYVERYLALIQAQSQSPNAAAVSGLPGDELIELREAGKHVPWSEEEDRALMEAYQRLRPMGAMGMGGGAAGGAGGAMQHGDHSRKRFPNWQALSEAIGGHRSAKACYHRLVNVLLQRPTWTPANESYSWTETDDAYLVRAVNQYRVPGSDQVNWGQVREFISSVTGKPFTEDGCRARLVQMHEAHAHGGGGNVGAVVAANTKDGAEEYMEMMRQQQQQQQQHGVATISPQSAAAVGGGLLLNAPVMMAAQSQQQPPQQQQQQPGAPASANASSYVSVMHHPLGLTMTEGPPSMSMTLV